jgi:hypothetical protein
VSVLPSPREGKVLGNLIGTKKDGKSALGNSFSGVLFLSGTDHNVVGGSTATSANVISSNGDDGVVITGSDTISNDVLQNSIFSNVGEGIDLILNRVEGDGPTKNDFGDADAGPNGLQNKPVVRSAVTSDGKTTIRGNLLSEPKQSYVVRFFSNPSGNEGKAFIGQKKVTTGADGKATFIFSPAQKVGLGKKVTATATGSEGTSEFSAPRTVTAS